jgi:hypothetical protein
MGWTYITHGRDICTCLVSTPYYYYYYYYYYYIVICQPIVGLRNRALLGSRPLNASRTNTRYATIEEAVFTPCRTVPCHAEPNRTVRCHTTSRWRHPATGVGEYRVTFAFPRVTQHSSHLARCCSDACTIEGFIRGTGMSKKSVFKKQLYESVVN